MTRRRLPDRRCAETFSFQVGGLAFTCTVGRFADGRIGEVFLHNHRSGSGSDVAARDAGIAVSFALQHGANLESIRCAVARDSHGQAIGPLGAALDRIIEAAPFLLCQEPTP